MDASSRIDLWKTLGVLIAVLAILVGVSAQVSAADALANLNWRRQAVGLRPYEPAPELQTAAEQSAANQARRGRMYHNSHRGARSGVGYSDWYDPAGRGFITCYAFARIKPGTRAAAAVATNGRSSYYALDIARGSGNRVCPKCGRVHR